MIAVNVATDRGQFLQFPDIKSDKYHSFKWTMAVTLKIEK